MHRLYATSPGLEVDEPMVCRETGADPSDIPRNLSHDQATHVGMLRRREVYAGRTAQADSVHIDRMVDPAEHSDRESERSLTHYRFSSELRHDPK